MTADEYLAVSSAGSRRKRRFPTMGGPPEAIAKLAEEAVIVDLTRTRIRNPFVTLFCINLLDAFEVVAHHGERHVR